MFTDSVNKCFLAPVLGWMLGNRGDVDPVLDLWLGIDGGNWGCEVGCRKGVCEAGTNTNALAKPKQEASQRGGGSGW